MILNVLGSFGTGKSSLVSLLSQEINAKPYFESVDSIILPKYYEGGEESRKRLSFALQIEFLNKRFRSLRSASKQDLAVIDSDLLADSIVYKVIHDRGEAEDEEFALYQNLLQNMMACAADFCNGFWPSLYIYLDIDPQKEVERIFGRGRQMEVQDSLVDYYHDINQGFKDFYAGYSQSPVLRIDCTNLDFVNDEHDQELVLEIIEQEIVKLGLKPKSWLGEIRAKRKFYDVNYNL